MGFIYKITNDINEKVYIGKTLLPSIEDRFKEHLRDYSRDYCKNRPLYKAMNKYGPDNFHISLIGEYPDQELSEMEVYWIGYYNGYTQGYNATLGGDGKQLYDYDAILTRLKEHPFPIDVANEFNCCADIPQKLAQQYNIPVKNRGNELKKTAILRLDKKTEEILQYFDSATQAGQWCLDNNLSTNASLSGLIRHIIDTAKGVRKSAYGFKWRYANK